MFSAPVRAAEADTVDLPIMGQAVTFTGWCMTDAKIGGMTTSKERIPSGEDGKMVEISIEAVDEVDWISKTTCDLKAQASSASAILSAADTFWKESGR